MAEVLSKPELRTLANFVRDKATSTGLSLHGFTKKHKLNYRTVSVLTKALYSPEPSTLTSVAKALRAETGENITLEFLQSLIDPGDDSAPNPDIEFTGSAIDREQLLDAYKRLDYNDRLAIAGDLIKLCLEDLETLTLTPRQLIGRLIERELLKRGVGIPKFSELIQIDKELLTKIVKAVEITVGWQDLVTIAANVRDRWGDYENLHEFAPLIGNSSAIVAAQIRDYAEQNKLKTPTQIARQICRVNNYDKNYAGLDLLESGIERLLAGEELELTSKEMAEVLSSLSVALAGSGDTSQLIF